MDRKKLLLFSAAVIAATAGYLVFPETGILLRGLMQAIYEGNSSGKLYFASVWFAVFPLAVLALNRFGFVQKTDENLVLKLFAIAVAAGFLLGLIQMLAFTSQFDSFYLSHGTMLSEEGYKNWEGSGYSHNHFPKISLHFMEKAFNLYFGGKFDNGAPWYELFEYPELWSIGFIALVLAAFISGTAYAAKRIKKTSMIGFACFAAGMLGILLKTLDGGVLDSGIPFIIFFFAVYWAEEKKERLFWLAPALVSSFAIVLLISTGLRGYSGTYPVSIIVFLSILYYFYAGWKNKKLKPSLGNIALIVVLLITANASAGLLFDFAYGLQVEGSDQAIFIYGIPGTADSSEIRKAIEEFAEVKEFEREDWLAYAIVDAEKPFRTGEIEEKLRKQLNPETYLYVVSRENRQNYESFKVYWFEDVEPEKFIKNKFLDIEVVKIEHDSEKNVSLVRITGKINYTMWKTLALLSHIRQNGFEGKLMLHTT